MGADAINLANSWARLAWQSVTEKGFSFGFYDLFDMKGSSKGKLVSLVSDGKHSGERNVAMMVCSGANGEDQISQIICKRGNLNGLRDEKCEISSCLVDGMPWQDLFDASWNARHSLCNKKLGTAKAGGLTRKLVLGLWPLGNVGLVAAQSIGERGTQLAMKGIHGSAGVEKSTGTIRDYIKGKRPIGDSFDDFIKAVTEERTNKYTSIDERQFKVLWDALRADLFSNSQDWADLLQGSLRIKLVELARDSQCLSMESPFAKVLFNLF